MSGRDPRGGLSDVPSGSSCRKPHGSCSGAAALPRAAVTKAAGPQGHHTAEHRLWLPARARVDGLNKAAALLGLGAGQTAVRGVWDRLG